MAATSKRGRDEPLPDALHKRRNEGDASRGASSASGSDYDDEAGHVHIRVGEYIANVYKYMYEGGKGTFGKVLMCEDRSSQAGDSGRLVAIKVVRKIKKYSESARIEAELLADIARADPSGASGSVRAHRYFTWQEHVCIVFEPLGMSLFDYVKANAYRPLPLFCVQSFADQLTRAVAFLHSMGLVHTDLKLENVLLVSRAKLQPSTKETAARNGATNFVPQSTEIKLIDFGGATYITDPKKSSLINTRQYRSPEVILGMEWSSSSDVWSIGCMLMELYTGELLFPTVRFRITLAHLVGVADVNDPPPPSISSVLLPRQHDNAEHLALIEAIIGPFPLFFLREQPTVEVRRYFDYDGRSYFPNNAQSRASVAKVRAAKRLSDIIRKRDTVFLDLVSAMLKINPRERITAKEAANHKFFTVVRGHKELLRPAGRTRIMTEGYYRAATKNSDPLSANVYFKIDDPPADDNRHASSAGGGSAGANERGTNVVSGLPRTSSGVGNDTSLVSRNYYPPRSVDDPPASSYLHSVGKRSEGFEKAPKADAREPPLDHRNSGGSGGGGAAASSRSEAPAGASEAGAGAGNRNSSGGGLGALAVRQSPLAAEPRQGQLAMDLSPPANLAQEGLTSLNKPRAAATITPTTGLLGLGGLPRAAVAAAADAGRIIGSALSRLSSPTER